MFLYDEDVAAWLNALTDKEFIEFFYKHLASRRINDDPQGIHNRLALAEIIPHTNRRQPLVHMLCTSPGSSPADAPIKWLGQCCGFLTGSWRRSATCPACGAAVRDA